MLVGFGINAQAELAYALQKGGARCDLVHFNQLMKDDGSILEDYQILALPGGFSFGDDIQAGRVLANKFRFKLKEPLKRFVDAGKPMLGICNGFQVLVQLGVLPGWDNWERKMTLARNAQGRFEDRWVNLRSEDCACPFARHLGTMSMPVRHGEGQAVFSSPADLKRLIDGMQVVFKYANPDGSVASGYPANPNGSVDSIAGICNPAGNVLGLMPHPECHVDYLQSPGWTSNPPLPPPPAQKKGLLASLAYALGLSKPASIPEPADEGNCQALFDNIVEHAKKF